jgi:cephalosporin hydroxylase
MTEKRQEILDTIWGGKDPFAEKSAFRGRVDFQGWTSDHSYLARAIDEVRPQIVVEVGVWKGGSVITMGKKIQELGLNSAIIAVDTWLGSWDHWTQPIWFESLRFESGYSTLYKTFAANILESDLRDIVLPLPLDSLNAAMVLKSKDITPEVVHIDGGHDFDAVLNDLKTWWPRLTLGGALIGDDYYVDGITWPTVREAFHAFFGSRLIENLGGKCYIRKTPDMAVAA